MKLARELDYDVVRDVGSSPLVYAERTVADGGWRVSVVGKNLLISLQRTTPNANEIEFRSLMSKSGLNYLRVGAKTAKAMGISRWVNIQLIPESQYSALIAPVVANAASDVMEGPFTSFLEQVKSEVEDPDAPQRP